MSWAPLLLSIEVAIASTLIAGLVGVGLGLLLARRTTPARDLLDVIVTAPMILPPTVLGYYVLVLLGRSSPLGEAFEALTGMSVVFTPVGAVLAAVIGAVPLVAKSSRAAFEAIEPALISAARTLGASPARAFWTIELPLATRGVVAGLMLGFARALGDFGVTLMVAGNIPGSTQTASLAIYDAIQAGRDGDALGLVLTLTAIGLVPLYLATKLGRPRGA